jgi:hypothetical protein
VNDYSCKWTLSNYLMPHRYQYILFLFVNCLKILFLFWIQFRINSFLLLCSVNWCVAFAVIGIIFCVFWGEAYYLAQTTSYRYETARHFKCDTKWYKTHHCVVKWETQLLGNTWLIFTRRLIFRHLCYSISEFSSQIYMYLNQLIFYLFQ